MQYIAVFCGSSKGSSSHYAREAAALGRSLAMRGFGMIYGGTHVGLMGIAADACLEAGGKVIGVIPEFLKEKHFAHEGLTELQVVRNIHERKRRMNDLSDGVIALPGGYGTMDELFEMLARVQLGLYHKPVALYNIDGFYDPLCLLVKNMIKAGFLKSANQKILFIERDVDKLLDQMTGELSGSEEMF